MRFEFGSYHFIDSPKEREQSPSPFAVTVSFCNLAMNPQSVTNPRISGVAITMDRVQCNALSLRCTENTVNIPLRFHSVH